MKLTAIALALLALSAAPASAEQRETERVDRTIAFAGGGTLKLRNFSGNVRVTGTSGNDIVIHAVRRATRERLDNIRLDISVEGSTVVVEANKRSRDWSDRDNNVVDTEFDVQVPASTTLDLYAFSGDLQVSDTTREIKARTFSGSITVDVSRAPAMPDVDAETFSGNIKTRVPANGSGRVDFNTFSGDLKSDVPLMLRDSSRKHMSADLGSGGGSKLEFKTFSGDLRIQR
jgi:DUF4097 and DUF4098 domain-containing protein YvlB